MVEVVLDLDWDENGEEGLVEELVKCVSHIGNVLF